MASRERSKTIRRIHYYKIGDIIEFKSMSPKIYIEKNYSVDDHLHIFFKNNCHSGIILSVKNNSIQIRTTRPLPGIVCWIKNTEIIKNTAESY